MRRFVHSLVLCLLGTAAFAQGGSPTTAGACDRALDALQAHEAAVLAARRTEPPADAGSPRAVDPQILRLRRDAARACLGPQADTTPRPQPEVRPPQAVPPLPGPRLKFSHPAPPSAAPPAAPSAPLIKPPAPALSITGCDATACTASDGTRLPRVGPDVLGPRGLCSLQGTALICP